MAKQTESIISELAIQEKQISAEISPEIPAKAAKSLRANGVVHARGSSQFFSVKHQSANHQSVSHQRTQSIFDKLFFVNPEPSLSLKIETTFIVDESSNSEELPYARIYTKKEFKSLIITKNVWSPPPTVIFYSDSPNKIKHFQSPYFPIAMDITKSNIRFPKIVLDNIVGKPKTYFVVQTGGDGLALHCEQAFFKKEQVNDVIKNQLSQMNTPCKITCSIEIFSNNPKIKCEKAKISSLDASDASNAIDASEIKIKSETEKVPFVVIFLLLSKQTHLLF